MWMKASEYLDITYTQKSRPPYKSFLQWVRDGKYGDAVEKRGRNIYINPDLVPTRTGNDLVDKVLNKAR